MTSIINATPDGACAAALDLRNLCGKERIAGQGPEGVVPNPANTDETVGTFRYSTAEDVQTVVAAAEAAFPAWRDMPIVRRCRILAHCKEVLEQHVDELATIIVRENGKTLGEAEGELRRGLEVLEFAVGMPSLSKGDYIVDISQRVDGYMIREPLGVIAGACPFNFPGMIPMWMFPVAIACGNTFVLKPSDKCPGTATRLVELFLEAGLPAGVLNVVQGGKETLEALAAHDAVKAISFVGSTPVAEAVWKLGTANHKRVQALGGAKNFNLIMPDAPVGPTLEQLIGSAYGCAGERCMATSIAVLVGEAESLLPEIVETARNLKIGNGLNGDTQMGPVITAEHKQRVERYLDLGVKEGATLVLDGREAAPATDTPGHFLGASVFDNVTSDMTIAKDEIFGPVLSVMRAADLDEAIGLANQSPFGNGGSIFTNSGGAARHFRTHIQCGMLGINAGVPAPMAMFSFGGHKRSIFGDLRAQGPDAIEFYTQKKSVIERWIDAGPTGNIWSK